MSKLFDDAPLACFCLMGTDMLWLKSAQPFPFVFVQHNYVFPRGIGMIDWVLLPECKQVLVVDHLLTDIRWALRAGKGPGRLSPQTVLIRVVSASDSLLIIRFVVKAREGLIFGGQHCLLPMKCMGPLRMGHAETPAHRSYHASQVLRSWLCTQAQKAACLDWADECCSAV